MAAAIWVQLSSKNSRTERRAKVIINRTLHHLLTKRALDATQGPKTTSDLARPSMYLITGIVVKTHNIRSTLLLPLAHQDCGLTLYGGP